MIYSLPSGTPSVSGARFIAENATIAGDVTIGAESTVWFSAVLRAEGAPITIGRETSIQDNVTVHIDLGRPTRIGDRVTVGHNAVLHGCTVEDDVLIGMNSTVLNGAVVGRGSLVAAGALVPEGMVVPPNSLVAGVPAKVKRTFTPEEVQKRQDYYIPLYAKEGAEYAEALGQGA